MLAGCSSNSSLVSSFSQRTYTKGYFADAIGEKPTIISKRINERIVTHTTPVTQNSATANAFKVTENINSTSVLSVKQKKPVRNISPIAITYKKVIEPGDSTKTKDSTSPKKLTALRKFWIMNWWGIYMYTLLILGLLTKFTTGIAYTIINISFFTLLTPLLLIWSVLIFYAIYCLITKQHMW